MKYSTKLPVFALLLSIFAFVSCQKDVVTNNEAEQRASTKTSDLVYKADTLFKFNGASYATI